ncbi:hypothetical protein N0V88_002760 [Collariella sp. IMI 366227]|nr:hypothetical protein N0V88_002760 [Collariella sp. IMI 366227]
MRNGTFGDDSALPSINAAPAPVQPAQRSVLPGPSIVVPSHAVRAATSSALPPRPDGVLAPVNAAPAPAPAAPPAFLPTAAVNQPQAGAQAANGSDQPQIPDGILPNGIPPAINPVNQVTQDGQNILPSITVAPQPTQAAQRSALGGHFLGRLPDGDGDGDSNDNDDNNNRFRRSGAPTPEGQVMGSSSSDGDNDGGDSSSGDSSSESDDQGSDRSATEIKAEIKSENSKDPGLTDDTTASTIQSEVAHVCKICKKVCGGVNSCLLDFDELVDALNPLKAQSFKFESTSGGESPSSGKENGLYLPTIGILLGDPRLAAYQDNVLAPVPLEMSVNFTALPETQRVDRSSCPPSLLTTPVHWPASLRGLRESRTKNASRGPSLLSVNSNETSLFATPIAGNDVSGYVTPRCHSPCSCPSDTEGEWNEDVVMGDAEKDENGDEVSERGGEEEVDGEFDEDEAMAWEENSWYESDDTMYDPEASSDSDGA